MSDAPDDTGTEDAPDGSEEETETEDEQAPESD